METRSLTADRKVAALRQAFRPVISAALGDRRVVEVIVNADGKIWVDTMGEGRALTGERVALEDANRILRLLADHVGEVVTKHQPRISATLPETLRSVSRRQSDVLLSPSVGLVRGLAAVRRVGLAVL